MAVVGKDIPHDSARGHVSGESVFIDDLPPVRGEVLVEFVGAPVAAGNLRAIDIPAAAKPPGIAGVFTAKDVTGHNTFGPVIADEHLLVPVGGEIYFLGDPVALIAAETREQLRAAKKLIKLEIEPAQPIFSIDEAITAGTFIGPKRTIASGDVDASLKSADHTLQGVTEIGGQEHFYLESQAALAIPGEHGQITVHSSTQHPSEVQTLVAEVLGVPFNHVTVICKRMGGGFGGKETQAAQPAIMAALVAKLTRRPARIVYSKDDDMRFTGKRHPFQSRWKVGFSRDGRITALAVDHYSNGGCTADLSLAVMERAMLHSENAYFIENIRITGQVCRTNLPSNTAFRGFGGPQGVANIENVIEEIARFLRLDPLEVRRRNLYAIDSRNTTPYGQIMQNNTLPELVEKLSASAEYAKRRVEIDAFNAGSTTHLRGLAMTFVKFGISFTRRTLNQANALVNLYQDGTVMVSTGGTEMGQGVNTRVRQLVADELGVPYDAVIVTPTSTDKNNNTSPTAASSGTDLNGAAAVDACRKLRGRLAEFAGSKVLCEAASDCTPSPDNVVFEGGFVYDARRPQHRIPFKQLICAAYIERVNLGERGFYATPGVDFNRETGKGHPFLYFTNGAAVSEVVIDRFTGEMKVTRVDLLMDAGVPINPGIDRGQITGAFIQGMGWVTTEELRYAENGALLTYSPTTYKIPNAADVPPVFNVALLENRENAVSLRRSKALGEPPLLLAVSAWAAVKNALAYACPPALRESPQLRLPATGEHILMLLTDLERCVVGQASTSAMSPTTTPAPVSPEPIASK